MDLTKVYGIALDLRQFMQETPAMYMLRLKHDMRTSCEGTMLCQYLAYPSASARRHDVGKRRTDKRVEVGFAAPDQRPHLTRQAVVSSEV